MGSRISDEKIEKIRNSVDIVDVISEYVQLKKQGRNLIGLCPFHGENTPSFSVSPEKQLYHCFGCGAGGNAFSFMMAIEGYEFLDSVKHLATKANIDLPELEKSETSNASSELNAMIAGNELAAKLYHHLLMNTEQGKDALDYLVRRGFTEEMIQQFSLGFAPDSWETLTQFFQKRNVPLHYMEQIGLLAKRDFDGKLFDRYRNRVIFPIWNKDGKVIGFGGRVLGNEQPKYLNSSDSKVFNKSNTLYGLHIARPEMRKKNEAVLFEGYVDVIAAWQAGVRNGIATLGTAITDEQAKLIRRNAQTVIVCYDSDNAGLKATYRAIQILEANDCYVKVARLPEGYDPDDYIQENGPEKFRVEVIGANQTTMAFKMNFLRRGKNLQNEGERMQYIEDVLGEITSLTKSIERDHYVRQLADEFSLSLDVLKQELLRLYKFKNQKNVNQPKQNKPSFKSGFVTKKRLLPAFHNAERILLAFMMKDINIASTVKEKIGGNFNIDEYQSIVAYLYSYYAEGNEPNSSQFIQRLHDDKLARIATEIAMMATSEELSEQELYDYFKQITNYPKIVKIEEKEKERKEAESREDYAQAARIAMEIIQMKKDLKH
ncbi:DNA primase [Anaerobacillus isosaccharinicus]|uniref:DNA primase n=1 Tax=Anaerobacillus isosaccharinicus TaxID=1532552 RepID=A0A1S2LRN2_9BACI|nr:DNA primase [Anaerobacillus isosaccharinicus]MBA5585511.1 DNA primase [Anaerobacillus isosaccharinicus]QOY36175.1 DNA primase [Anaerobacillus isosaccharinicus]